ncbi:MAG: glycosyltransferase family 4 protein [Tatlockia sp.]|nr:glycosyltransferase family 4 protein [Tatlockia sp.]
MKIALCSSYVPFINGGARNIVDWLEPILKKEGHQVERIYLPQVDAAALLFQQKMAYRWVDLESADRIICFRPPAHYIPHPHKILWFIHHIRVFYDLWDSPYRGFPDDLKHRGIRDALHQSDSEALKEAKTIFTNSAVVSKRLKDFNHIDSEILYPPVFEPERFHCKGYNDEVVYICRLEHHKRQHLLVEAMQYTQTSVRLRLCGTSTNPEYSEELTNRIDEYNLNERVTLDNRWISEEEKVELLSNCLAAIYLPIDEDSYGYPSIEASLSSKAVLTTVDSGGVLELIEDGLNGFVSEPSPEALAEALDKLYRDQKNTQQMGLSARSRLNDLNICWSHVVKRLLA